ncbi:MAG: hypothetical protein K6L80_04180 [Agarilytica sp.]
MASFFPAIGSWYIELATGQLFEIIAVDEKYGTIEIQYEDGDLAEYDGDAWGHLDIAMATAPEQGNAHFGSASFDVTDSSNMDNFYGDPLQDIEPESFQGFDDLF